MPKRLLISIGLLSVAVIAFQLVLMQILSITQWYHFAYMVISVAMLGFGFSGTVLAVAREWFLERSETIIPLLMILSGLSMAVVIPVTQSLLGGFDMYLLFVDTSQIWLLLVTYLIYLIPFFLAALAIGLMFVKYVASIGTVYFANLIGSGLGGITAIAFLWSVLPNQLPGLTAVFPVAAGLLLITRKYRSGFIILSSFSIIVSLFFIIRPVELNISEYKSISYAMNLPGAVIENERVSPHGLLQAVSSDALRHAPGLSLAYTGEIPVRKAVLNNGEWFGPLVVWAREDTTHLMDYTTTALPFIVGRRERVLVINARTGTGISHALTNGARQVTAVEPNIPAVSMMLNEYAGEIDSLFHHPSVNIHTIEPRTYLKISREQYDLIMLPTVDAFGGTAGLYALQEQYVLTREAFAEMWRLLSPDGMISITSWMDYPVRNPLKILATLVELLETEGIEKIDNHIIAIRSWGTVSFFVRRSSITSDEIEAIRGFCRTMFFDPVILPGLVEGERTRYNDIDDRSFFGYVDEILASDRRILFDEYDFRLRPASDNRPYFSQFLRWRTVPHLRGLFGDRALPFLEVGYLFVVVTFIQIFLAAVVLIILPLFKIGFRGGGKTWTVLYFSGLGFGFMFIEIVLIQRFILYLGHPIYSAAAVITALLICSGVGSYVSSRFSAVSNNLRYATGIVAGFTLLYIVILPILLEWTIGLPLSVKGLLAFLFIAPPAFFMGMPFPLGLRYVSLRNENHVPWAWGINGCMSVVSTALATIIAVEFGFAVVMLCAAAAYGVAMGVCRNYDP
jgi:SAM-dependent methyltransferase